MTDKTPTTKNERRQAAREKAKALREEQHRREKRKRLIIQSSVVVGVIAVVAAVALLVTTLTKPAAMPANMQSDGIAFTTGLTPVLTDARESGSDPVAYESADDHIVVDVYLDFMCPYCQQFELTNGQYITTQVSAGNIDVVYHPVEILDRLSQGTNYSTRAAAAAASVANYAPDSFITFQSRLFDTDVKPEENTAGLTEDELVQYAREAIGDDNADLQQKVEDSIRSGEFKSWVAAATKASPAAENGTPYVTVNGEAWNSTAQSSDTLYSDFPDYVNDLLEAKGIDPNAGE